MKRSVISILFLTAGCATSTYKVQSVPAEAEVTFVMASGEKKSMGKTPASVGADEINPSRLPFLIEVKKVGYETKTIYVMDSPFSKNLEASLNLQAALSSGDGKGSPETLNLVSSAVADIQKDIQSKNYSLALERLNRLQIDYPGVATFHSLTGNVHYLEKRLDRALDSYRQSLLLNPNQNEVQKMINKIESFQGGKP